MLPTVLLLNSASLFSFSFLDLPPRENEAKKISSIKKMLNLQPRNRAVPDQRNGRD